MAKWLDKIIEVAEGLGWTVVQEYDKTCDFGKYSTEGQDFHFCIDIGDNFEDFMCNLRNYINDFDVSFEAYLCLDENGHGCNGAPYEMIDVYKDTEECLHNMEELRDSLDELDIEDLKDEQEVGIYEL